MPASRRTVKGLLGARRMQLPIVCPGARFGAISRADFAGKTFLAGSTELHTPTPQTKGGDMTRETSLARTTTGGPRRRRLGTLLAIGGALVASLALAAPASAAFDTCTYDGTD